MSNIVIICGRSHAEHYAHDGMPDIYYEDPYKHTVFTSVTKMFDAVKQSISKVRVRCYYEAEPVDQIRLMFLKYCFDKKFTIDFINIMAKFSWQTEFNENEPYGLMYE